MITYNLLFCGYASKTNEKKNLILMWTRKYLTLSVQPGQSICSLRDVGYCWVNGHTDCTDEQADLGLYC